MSQLKYLYILVFLASCLGGANKSTDDKKNLTLMWRKPNFNWITSSIYVKNNTIYFGSFNDSFYSADLKSGEMKIKFKTGYDPFYLPIVEKNRIYFSSFDLNVYCIDTLGNLIWKFPTEGRVKNNLICDDSSIFVSVRNDALFALNKDDGKLIWSLPQDSQGATTSQPILFNENIYIGSWGLNNNLIAVNKKTGKIVWNNRMYPDFSSSAPMLSNRGLVVTIDKFYKGGQVKMLQYESGKEIWTASLKCETGIKPFISNDNVVVGTYDNSVVCFNVIDGKIKWMLKLEKDDNVQTEFCALNQKIYFGTSNRNLYCVDLNTGKTIFKEMFYYGISDPIVSNGKVYIATGGDELWLVK